ncbi:hypothetical protein [Streptomyces sp. NPDC051677]|uniref:hypothetical protein n=1 Tax=Streptomyces sp. NPDC051677 TaxID=3365669 RepID=UPI0037D55260
MHDSYRRRLKDLPLDGQIVVIHLTVRRFICGADDCQRRTYAELFAQLTARYSRFTTRLNHVLERVGLALAGQAGTRCRNCPLEAGEHPAVGAGGGSPAGSVPVFHLVDFGRGVPVVCRDQAGVPGFG